MRSLCCEIVVKIFRVNVFDLFRVEVEFHLDAVGIEQKQLVKRLVINLSLLNRNRLAAQVFQRLGKSGTAKSDVINNARTVHGFGLLAEITLADI